jgi:uncharacterized membrane protein
MEQDKEICNSENMKLSTNTVIGLTFGQIITLITYTAFVVIMYADIIERLNKVEDKQKDMQGVCEKQEVLNERFMQATVNIEKSLIRIEGKLDMKQDKYK